eukprot:COSAG01_NODE_71218_length_256_cov_1.292994_1_plen_57_part_01
MDRIHDGKAWRLLQVRHLAADAAHAARPCHAEVRRRVDGATQQREQGRPAFGPRSPS